jgi:hypothetical protein
LLSVVGSLAIWFCNAIISLVSGVLYNNLYEASFESVVNDSFSLVVLVADNCFKRSWYESSYEAQLIRKITVVCSCLSSILTVDRQLSSSRQAVVRQLSGSC